MPYIINIIMAINPIQVQKFLGGMNYPASKKELVEKARENGAPDDVIELLENLKNENFDEVTDVTEAISNAE